MPELYPGQIEGVEWIKSALAKYNGCILADRPGWGKTAQAVETAKGALSKGPILIICPAYIIYNWLEELTLWGIDRADICIIDSTKQILHAASWYVVSYNMAAYFTRKGDAAGRLIKKPGPIFQQLFAISWGLIIADESHALKNPGALRSRLILGTGNNKKTNLLNKTDKMLMLTGTPLINRVDELYNLIVKIAPQILKGASRYQFIMHFAGYIESTSWGLKHSGVKNEDELKALIAPVLLSRTRIDGLPDRIDKKIKLPVKGRKLEAYIKEEEAFISRHGLTVQDARTLDEIKKLDGGLIAELRQRAAMFKIPALLDALETDIENGDPCLIGVYHKAVQAAVKAELEQRYKGIKIGIINGGVDKKRRHAIITAYQAGKLDAILTTISAMREGVNVTRGAGVYILEYPWTPAELEQFIARAHRSGQDKTVYVRFFQFTGGIDALLSRTLAVKKTMIKKVMLT